MYIEEIIVDGFKSYATRTVISGWDPEFNCITGLNGSGKSNVLDAICFVLGITNLSQVRASNLQELVYKRGQAGISKASVTIVFNNERKEKSPIGFEDSPTISVTRQVVIGGRNKYLINGHNAQQQTVANLFQSVQLNVNNPHFLIMQGRITKVLNMKPPEILAMIEEAAGTRMFEERRDKALKTIGKKEKKLEEINSLLAEEIGPKLDKYRKEKKSYLEFQKIQSELDQIRRLVIAYEYKTLEDKLSRSTGESNSKNERIEALFKVEKEVTSRIASMETRVKELSAKKAAEMGQGGKLQALEVHVREVSKELVKVKTQWDNMLKTIKEECQARVNLLDTKKEAESGSEDAQAKYEMLRANFEQVRQSHEDKTKNVQKLEQLLQTLTTGISAQEGQENGYMEQLQAAKNAITIHMTEVEQAKLKINHIRRELADAAPKSRKAEKESQNLLAEVEKSRASVSQVELRMSQLDWGPQKGNELSAQKNVLSEEMEKIRREIEILSSQLSSCQFTYSNPSPNFDRLKVKGLVAELVQIPKENINAATALEICAGGKLYNVVVETASIGSQLLEKGKLRKRVTIIPLNMINAFKVSAEKIATAQRLAPGKVNLALSLVGYDDDVVSAMKYVFGSTFVCEDDKTANQITFDPQIRIKSVTLQGDVYDPSGTLQGGSKPSSSGLLLKMQRLRELKEALLEKEKELNIIQHNLKAGTEFNQLKGSWDLKKHELSLLEEQVQSSPCSQIAVHIQTLKAQLESLEHGIGGSNEKKNIAMLNCKVIEKDMKEFSSSKETKLKAIQADIRKEKKELLTEAQSFKIKQREVQVAKMEVEQQERDVQDNIGQLSNFEQALEQYRKEEILLKKQFVNIKDSFDNLNDDLEKERSTMTAFDSEIKFLELEKRKQLKLQTDSQLEIQNLEREIERFQQDNVQASRALKEHEKHHEWVSNLNIGESRKRVTQLEQRHATLKRNINEKAMEMIDRMEKKEKSLKQMLDTVKRDKMKIEDTIESLDQYKREALQKTWEKVNGDFGAILAELFPGNTAKLEAPEGQDITEGLEVKVCLGGVWKESLTELSGGQRSLIALSLILSLLQFKPAPMYILDEVDAALDLSHTQNIGHLLRTRFKGSQFIVVSLKEGLFNNANVLFRARFRDGVSIVERHVLHQQGKAVSKENVERGKVVKGKSARGAQAVSTIQAA